MKNMSVKKIVAMIVGAVAVLAVAAVAAVLGEQCPVPIRRVGVKDVFGHSGPAWELLEQFGLRSDAIIAAVKELV